MKIRNFSLCITFFALMIAIWCMTPPATNLIVKILCTILVVGLYLVALLCKRFQLTDRPLKYLRHFGRLCASALCFLGNAGVKAILLFAHLVTLPFRALRRLIKKFFNTRPVFNFLQNCKSLFSKLLKFADWCALKFASWSFQADPELLRERRRAIIEDLGYRKRPHHPLYRTKFWCNVTNLFCCIAMLTANLALIDHFGLQIILFAVNVVLLNCISAITSLATTFDDYDPQITEQTDPNIGILCIVAQLFLPIIFFVVALILKLVGYQSLADPSLTTAYFTIQLNIISLHLTIPEAIIITSTLLALLGYGNLCVAAHDIAFPSNHQPTN